MLTGGGEGRFDVSWSGAAGKNPMDLAMEDLDVGGLVDLAALRAEDERVQVVEQPLGDSKVTRIAALDQRLEEVAGTCDIDQRPAIQVIQRAEVETGEKKK